jgi:UDP:flavonoid glycosyltransferase YjiC (YdhE family)
VRILVTSTPGAGHIHPIVPIARALADSGHDVVWATAHEGCARVAALGFDAVPAGMGSRERMEQLLATTPEFPDLPPRARRAVAFGGLFGRIAAPPMRDALSAVFDDVRPDVVVHDIAELAGPPMAVARGIPHVTVAFSGAIPAAVLDPAVREAAPVWAAEGLDVPDDLGFADHVYLHPFPAAFGPAPAGPTVRSVRPMHVDGARDDDPVPGWIAGLGAGRPTLYVTFGTELGPRAPWPGLLATLGALDVEVVATTGAAVPAGVLGDVPADVHVVDYVPQRFVLDRASVVVSHAGAGTVLATAGRGIPQLCLPVAADQFENADGVARSGAGLTLEPDARGPDDLATAVTRLLEDPTFRERAVAVATEITALPHPRELVAEIERLTAS